MLKLIFSGRIFPVSNIEILLRIILLREHSVYLDYNNSFIVPFIFIDSKWQFANSINVIRSQKAVIS